LAHFAGKLVWRVSSRPDRNLEEEVMRSDNPSLTPSPAWHPHRVTRPHDRCGAPLTAPQRAVLEALVHLCPRLGADVCPRAVAASAELRLGSVVLTLRNLERRRLAVEHPAQTDDDRPRWSPTLVGRSRVRRHHDPATERRFT
jgi:DNA-binding MarR family transcriptional regulator